MFELPDNRLKKFSSMYLELSTVLVVELQQTEANYMSPFSFCLLNKTRTVISYIKPLIRSNISLNKTLMLDLVAVN